MTSDITVLEGGVSEYITVTIPLPPSFMCRRDLSKLDDECVIMIDAQFESLKKDFKCSDNKDKRLPQAVIGYEFEPITVEEAVCGIKITDENWMPQFKIPIRAKVDMRAERKTAVRKLYVYEKHIISSQVIYQQEITTVTVRVLITGYQGDTQITKNYLALYKMSYTRPCILIRNISVTDIHLHITEKSIISSYIKNVFQCILMKYFLKNPKTSHLHL